MYTGGSVDPTYFQVTALELDPTGLAACDEDSVFLNEVVISDPDGIALTYCGTPDFPCFGPVSLAPTGVGLGRRGSDIHICTHTHIYIYV